MDKDNIVNLLSEAQRYQVVTRDKSNTGLIDYCLDNKLFKQITPAHYRLAKRGQDFLDGVDSSFVETTPNTKNIVQKISNTHTGTFILRIVNTDWFKLIVSAIIGLVVGTWLLVKFKIIK